MSMNPETGMYTPEASAAPSGDNAVVVPSDSTIFATPFRGLWVGVAGNITIRNRTNKALIQFANVPVGWMPIYGDMVMATGTSATTMVAAF